MPMEVPLEYDLLRDLPIPLLRNRLVLLHYFSDLLSPIVSMLPLNGDISLDKLRCLLVYSAKESIFRKVSTILVLHLIICFFILLIILYKSEYYISTTNFKMINFRVKLFTQQFS